MQVDGSSRPRRATRMVSYRGSTAEENKYNKIAFNDPNNDEFLLAIQILAIRGAQVNRKSLKKYMKRKLEDEAVTIW